MVRMKENNMTSKRKKRAEKMYDIPGMKGALTMRALSAFRNVDIDPSDMESLKAFSTRSVAGRIYMTDGVGKMTWAHIVNFAESNGVNRDPNDPCRPDEAARAAWVLAARERREAERAAELKRIEEQSYAVGSAWGDE